jgi:hypothetical protein
MWLFRELRIAVFKNRLLIDSRRPPMNPNNYGSLEACQRLVAAGIVLETENVWAFVPILRMVGGIEGNPPGKWELIQKPLFPYKDQVPASSMADVWRELPECIAADDVTWAFLTMGKMGDMTKVSYGPSWNALQGFLNTNPTDALIYLRIWLEERKGKKG